MVGARHRTSDEVSCLARWPRATAALWRGGWQPRHRAPFGSRPKVTIGLACVAMRRLKLSGAMTHTGGSLRRPPGFGASRKGPRRLSGSCGRPVRRVSRAASGAVPARRPPRSPTRHLFPAASLGVPVVCAAAVPASASGRRAEARRRRLRPRAGFGRAWRLGYGTETRPSGNRQMQGASRCGN